MLAGTTGSLLAVTPSLISPLDISAYTRSGYIHKFKSNMPKLNISVFKERATSFEIASGDAYPVVPPRMNSPKKATQLDQNHLFLHFCQT